MGKNPDQGWGKSGSGIKIPDLQHWFRAAGTCLLVPGHLQDREDDGGVGRGLLLQELDEGLGDGLVDLGGLSLVPGVSAPSATEKESQASHLQARRSGWKGSRFYR